MKEEFDFSQVPFHYLLCLNEECPKAESCLRQLAEQNAPAEVTSWMVVSPKYLATLQGECPFYRPSVKVRFAKGCIQMLNNLPHSEMLGAIRGLMSYFSRRTYYRVRKGERLLSPYEQQQVLRIIKIYSNAPLKEFDAYVDTYDW